MTEKLLGKVLNCILGAPELLEPCCEIESDIQDRNNRIHGMKTSSGDECSSSNKGRGLHEKRKILNVKQEIDKNRENRKRSCSCSRTWKTDRPHQDGYLWRKYGHKAIQGSDFEREYFRCTYKDSQNCPATKHVQQLNREFPPMFLVTYNENHTCKAEHTIPNFVEVAMSFCSPTAQQRRPCVLDFTANTSERGLTKDLSPLEALPAKSRESGTVLPLKQDDPKDINQRIPPESDLDLVLRL